MWLIALMMARLLIEAAFWLDKSPISAEVSAVARAALPRLPIGEVRKILMVWKLHSDFAEGIPYRTGEGTAASAPACPNAR